MLRISDLEIGYSPDRAIFPPISATSKGGELVALVGRNGVGKSTYLRTIAGLQRKIAGEVSILGRNIESVSRNEKARIISFVPAEPVRIPNLDILTFVALARFPHVGWAGKLSAEDWDMVYGAIKLVRIEHLTYRDISLVSDGERQRAMIAFALAQDTDIVLFDEPTAYLDLPNKFEIVCLLRDISHSKKKSIIYSTHDIQGAISEVDKLWLMHESKLVEGIPEELVLNNQLASLLDKSQVTFDMHTGTFRIDRVPTFDVILEGKGIELFWTKKLLHRLGFRIHDREGSFPLKISVQGFDSKIGWKVIKGESVEKQFSTISDLAIWLNENIIDLN